MKKSFFNLAATITLSMLNLFAFAQLSIKEKIKRPSYNSFTGNIFKTPGTIDSGDTIVFDMSLAVCTGAYVLVPISIITNDDIYAIDFSMKYNNTIITFDTTFCYKPYLNAAANFNVSDSTLRFTSFSFIQPIEHDTAVAAVRFNLWAPPLVASCLNSITAYLNGDACSFKLIDAVFPTVTIDANGPTVFMTGDSVSLSANASAGCSYLWSTGATTQTIKVYSTATYTVTVTSAGGCSATAATYIIVNTPLPVQLIGFDVNQIDDAMLISWTTANEINNDYFTVEHSTNGANWDVIKKVDGAANASAINNYSVTDYNPANGINYYRLNQTDYNGINNYSQVKWNYFHDKKLNDFKLTVYPNPVINILNISATENLKFQLTDINGKQVVRSDLIAGEEQQFNTHQLKSGCYILKAYNDNAVKDLKVIIEK